MKFSIVERPNPLNRKISLFYPQPVWTKMVTEENLIEEISFACSVNSSDIRAVLSCLVEFLPRHLMEGEAVKLDRFGIFRLSFESTGEDTEKKVSEKNILQAKVLFRPDVKIKNKLKTTSYKKVSSKTTTKNENESDLEA